MPAKRPASRASRSSTGSAKRSKKQPSVELENEPEIEEESSGSGSDEDGSSSEEDFEFESLAKHRSRRSVAGNRMQKLLEEQKQAKQSTMTEEDKEVYKDFEEVENDKDFEAEDRLKSDSEVDSDFDDDEQDVEPEDVGEQELRAEKRQDRANKSEQQRKKREKLMKELATNLMVADNVVDDKTHAKYITEAKQVAIKNKADLLKIEEQLAKRREEDLAAFKPIIRKARNDVIRLRKEFNKDGKLIKRITIPLNNLPNHSPNQLWLQRQRNLPKKPPGFDKIPPEIVGFGF